MGTILDLRANLQALRELVSILSRFRSLTMALAQREITDRYAESVLGVFWAIGHPLVLMTVYVCIFRFVFKIGVNPGGESSLDYATFILAGLIPWLAFTEVMSKSCVAIVSNSSFVKQVVFPVEVLPVKGVLSSLATQLVFLGLLIAYVLLGLRAIAWTYLLVPLLVLFQSLAMTGTAYFLAAIGVYLRDSKDLVQVLSVIGVYLIPTLYPPSLVPVYFRGLLFLNPFSYMVWCYQDALYFGRFEHPWAWPVFAATSVGVFLGGYRVFRALKIGFGNAL